MRASHAGIPLVCQHWVAEGILARPEAWRPSGADLEPGGWVNTLGAFTAHPVRAA